LNQLVKFLCRNFDRKRSTFLKMYIACLRSALWRMSNVKVRAYQYFTSNTYIHNEISRRMCKISSAFENISWKFFWNEILILLIFTSIFCNFAFSNIYLCCQTSDIFKRWPFVLRLRDACYVLKVALNTIILCISTFLTTSVHYFI